MPDMTGRTLGKYRLVERLGRGGMAEVYRAFQPNLEREVAIKVMHSYLAEDDNFIGRFKREAKAVANLRHAHIIQVYDFDIEDELYYMVMEFIEGETLKARLQRLNEAGRRMSLDEVGRVFRPLCDALDYAHEQGRIHRDLKPANVMFDGDRVVLTDFGLATIVGGTRYTLSGTVIGTPMYMSPEQGRGKAGDVRSEIYSLGVILYETVTGRVPYDADTPLGVIMKHVNEPLPLPSQVAEVPAAVERVILKAMAKEPEDRYPSAGALADALEAAIAGLDRPVGGSDLPSAAPAVVSPAEMGPAAEVGGPDEGMPVERPVVAEAAPAEVAKLAEEAPSVAPRPRRRGRVPWLPIGIGALVVVALVVAAMIVVPRLGRPTPPAGAPPTAEPPPRKPPADRPPPRDLEAAKAMEAGLEAFQAWDMERAIQAFTQVVELEPGYAPAYHMRGVAYREIDRLEEALADLDRAIELQPDFAQAYYDRGYLYLHYLDRPEEALADLSRTIELRPDHVDAYINRALVHLWFFDDDNRAMADLDRAIELEPGHPPAWCARGEVHFDREEYDLALADLTQAVELGTEDPYCIHELGMTHYMIGDYEQALHYYDQVIAREPGETWFYYGRGFAYLQLDALDRAIGDFDHILHVEPGNIGAHYGRGKALAAKGEYEAAIAEFTEVLADTSYSYEWPFLLEDHPYIDRAYAYYELDRPEDALNDLNALVDEKPDWHLPYYHRGRLYQAYDRLEEARADFERLLDLAPDESWREIAREALEEVEN